MNEVIMVKEKKQIWVKKMLHINALVTMRLNFLSTLSHYKTLTVVLSKFTIRQQSFSFLFSSKNINHSISDTICTTASENKTIKC